MSKSTKSNKAKNTQINEVSDNQEVKDILEVSAIVKQSVNKVDNEEVKESIKPDEKDVNIISSDEFIDDLEKTPVISSMVKEEKALVVKDAIVEKANQNKSAPVIQAKRYYTEDLDKQGSIKIGNKIYSKPSVNTLAI